MSGATPPAPPRVYWREFDLLRGLAVVMMVTHHVAVNLLDPRFTQVQRGIGLPEGSGGALGWAVWVGSFAPVVFFFVTGLGYGVQHAPGSVRPRSAFGLMRKVQVLVAADLLMWLRPGRWIGLDFFGFIAVSMLVLAGLLRSRHALAAAAGLLAAVVLVRFGIGPAAERLGATPGGWIDWWTGRVPVEGYAFPLFPWLGYPVAGFLLGAVLIRVRGWYDTHRPAVAAGCLGAALLLGLLSAAAVSRGVELYRWGSLTFSYFVAGFALLGALLALAAVAVSVKVAWARRPVEAISLRGVAAFAAVPVHFLAIGLCAWAGLPTAAASGAAWVCVGVILLWTVLVAHGFTPLSRWAGRRPNPLGWWIAGGAVVTAAMALLWWGHGLSADLRMMVAAVGQVVLCGMLVLPAVPVPQPREGPSVREPGAMTEPGRASM